MGRIYKRCDIWYIDVRAKGKRIRKRVGKSKRVAELALRDAEVKIARDEFGFTQHDISIEKLIERFLDFSSTNHRTSTTERYKTVFDHLCVFLQDKHPDVMFVSQLTPEVIEGYKSYRRNAWVNPNGHEVKSETDVKEHTRKGARARTINLEVDGVKRILNLAVSWGYLKNNPLRQVRSLKEDDKKPLRFLSVEECKLLLSASPSNLYPVFFTFLNTGMRKAELENLQWADVDFSKRKIQIRRKPDWQPKTGEREIPIGDGLLAVLSNLRKQNLDAVDTEYVFSAKGSEYSHNRLRRELIKIADMAGIESLTKLHTLRHTFASHLVMNGVDLPTVMKLMGHADIQTTMTYAHLASDHLASAVNKLPFS